MAQFICITCGARLSNTMVPNDIEYFLINSWVGDSQVAEYSKIVTHTNKTQRSDPYYEGEVDTWFDVSLELGDNVWVCPRCQTMHVFGKHGGDLEKVYKLVDKEDWSLDES